MRRKVTIIESVLCSLKLDDVVHIAPKGLNTIQIESNYQQTSVKNFRGEYFNYVRVTQKHTTKKHN